MQSLLYFSAFIQLLQMLSAEFLYVLMLSDAVMHLIFQNLNSQYKGSNY